MAHSEKKGKRSMVNGEQCRSQLMTGLPFTVYCSPNALRSALGALPHLVTAQSQVLRAWILYFFQRESGSPWIWLQSLATTKR
jgi:hypothetical protein